MSTAIQTPNKIVNGIDVEALEGVIREVQTDPSKGAVAFRVSSSWKGQTKSESVVESYNLGGQEVPRRFRIEADEPVELLGTNTAPNPQELLMTALNACMMVGYVAGAAVHGITLEMLEIETQGALDLRGFLGIDPAVPAGYESLRYVVRIKGDGTPEQFEEIHRNVMATSPNYFNISRPIRLEADLKVEA
ncbi:MAG: OsmC family protein [Myxococcales bacterium]|nr:OsmC family protein [Myxococcales bacterium]